MLNNDKQILSRKTINFLYKELKFSFINKKACTTLLYTGFLSTFSNLITVYANGLLICFSSTNFLWILSKTPLTNTLLFGLE